MAKTVPVKKHKRSSPSSPPHQGPGRKPGPKPVPVKKHKRSTKEAYQISFTGCS